MSTMKQEEILARARTVVQGLDWLRVQHRELLNWLQSKEDPAARDSVSDLVSKNVEMIKLGLGEAQAMLTLARHLQKVEADKQKWMFQVFRLRQENKWLKNDLADAQKKLRASEGTVAQLEEENNHLKFMASLRQYDPDPPVDDENAKDRPKNDPVVDLLSDDDDDDDDEERNTMSSPSQFDQQVITGYQIPERLRTIHNIAIEYCDRGHYDIAVLLCKQALEDLEMVWGHDHPDVATMLSIFALVYQEQTKYKEAINLLKDALAIRKKTFRENHIVVAVTLNYLAILYGKLGKYKKAEPLCKRALEIREKVLGKDHLEVAGQLRNLALLCQNQGKYEEVERYYQRALEIYESKLGPDDPNVAEMKKNLTLCYVKQGRYRGPEVMYK